MVEVANRRADTPSQFQTDDRSLPRYRVVTLFRRPGQRCEIPSHAHDVSIDPLPDGSAVRIQYRKPLRKIPFESDTDTPPKRYIN